MTDELEYVVKDALMICDKGAAPGFFSPTHNMHIKISGCLVTNRMDMLPVVNIPTFGVCACTGCACMPAPTMWQKTYKAKVKGQETLLARSYMPCALGGKIQFVTSGQIPLPPDALEDIKELQENGEQEEEEGWGWLDTLELVPVVGSIVGAVREGMKGNWGMMAMNIGFLVMDVAGIVSLGATTAAATAGKAAVKAGVKVAAKTVAKTVAKQTGKTGLKTGLKLTAKGAMNTFKKSMARIILTISKGKKCVLSCFPAGTLIQTENGLRPIEDIKIDDKVWSFNEKTKEISLKEVLQIMEKETDATIQITLDNEIVETTAEHPFYTEEGWKDAADLQAGDRIVSRSGNPIEIKEVSFQYNPKKVYNFEVSKWHTYFVGLLGLLVHNSVRPCFETLLSSKTPYWLKKIMKGNYFNFIREQYYKRMGGFNEVVVAGWKRLDSYIPNKEIVSRKFTQLKNVKPKTAKKYIDELVNKYSPGTKIKNTPRNAEAIAQGGDKLNGKMILEVPPQKKAIPPEVLEHATKKKVLIRDTSGKIYNP